MKYSKCIFAGSLALICLFFFFAQDKIEIDTAGCQTFGDEGAKNHIVVLEEFTCKACQRFHLYDLPILLSKYVDTGRAKITLIPSAYLDSSKAACMAALLWPSDKESYLRFLNYLFQNPYQFSKAEDFIEQFGESLPDTADEMKAEQIILKGRALCDRIYEQEIHMPTIFINNKQIKDISLNNIEKELNHD